jgi:hypothetical protein
MSASDRHTVAWAKRYQELLEGFVAALGGTSITPTRLAMAKQLATLQAESLALSDRFAASGQGASPDDINLFLRISSTIVSLSESAGLSKQLQEPIVHHADDKDNAIEKLKAAFDNIVAAQEAERAAGRFYDSAGALITNPTRLALARQIYDLQQQCDAIDMGDVTPTPAAPAEPVAPVAPAQAAPNVVKLRAAEPSMPRVSPPPPKNGPSSTELFYQWSGHDRVDWWGPV